MGSWATNLGKKVYQVEFSINVGYTILGDSEEEIREAMEGIAFDSRNHFFVEIEGNGVDWIAPKVEKVQIKDD